MKFIISMLAGIALTGGVLPVVYAHTNSYGAKLDQAKWELQGSRFKCKLTHEIPQYGTIEFAKEAGYPENSYLHLLYGRAVSHSKAAISFESPPWRTQQTLIAGWKFALTKVGYPVIFSARQARRILDAIELGLQPTITHIDNNDRRNITKAQISTVQFRQVYNKYLECQANMIPVTFAEVRYSSVYFDNASTRLDEDTVVWLSYILEYAKDPAVTRLELSGYTDSVGSFRANHQLASQRVEKVRDYFVQHGIDEKMLRLRVYGEQRAIAGNGTPEGRAKNRRVAIKVYR